VSSGQVVTGKVLRWDETLGDVYGHVWTFEELFTEIDIYSMINSITLYLLRDDYDMCMNMYNYVYRYRYMIT
jgi:hypothetical protein